MKQQVKNIKWRFCYGNYKWKTIYDGRADHRKWFCKDKEKKDRNDKFIKYVNKFVYVN